MPKKSTTSLTVKMIENAKPPKSGVKEIFDGGAPGMCLRIFAATGVKSFSLMARIDGKQRRIALGHFTPDKDKARSGFVTLADARAKAADLKAQIADGEDPTAKPTPDSAPGSVLTFGELAESYIKRECFGSKIKNGKVVPKLKRGWEIERILRREVLPHWADRQITKLSKPDADQLTRDAIQLTDALVDAGKPAAAYRLFETIRRVGRWAKRKRKIDFNPFTDMDPPAPKVPRDRVLKSERPAEIAAVWAAWDVMGYPFGPLGKLLLTTAQRLNEVAQMQWSEIDHDNKVWTIPAERTKSGRETDVPLSSLALEIIDSLPRFTEGAFVFTTRGGRRPVSGHSKAKARTDDLSGVTGWRLHDLRRTARTGLAELGIPEIIAEKVLNHEERNALAKIYNRYEYADEKRDALERWAARLREIIEAARDKVVVQLQRDGGAA